MKAIVDHLRLVVALAALALIVLGGLGRSMPVHPGMTRDAMGPSAASNAAAMPMDHAAMDSVSDADKAICEVLCRALAFTLPVSPVVLVPVPRAQTAQARAVLMPAPYWSRPDGPPPKHPIL